MNSNDFDFEKCGEIIVSPNNNVFALTCSLCHDVFMTLIEFKKHIRSFHDVFLQIQQTQESSESEFDETEKDEDEELQNADLPDKNKPQILSVMELAKVKELLHQPSSKNDEIDVEKGKELKSQQLVKEIIEFEVELESEPKLSEVEETLFKGQGTEETGTSNDHFIEPKSVLDNSDMDIDEELSNTALRIDANLDINKSLSQNEAKNKTDIDIIVKDEEAFKTNNEDDDSKNQANSHKEKLNQDYEPEFTPLKNGAQFNVMDPIKEKPLPTPNVVEHLDDNQGSSKIANKVDVTVCVNKNLTENQIDKQIKEKSPIPDVEMETDNLDVQSKVTQIINEDVDQLGQQLQSTMNEEINTEIENDFSMLEEEANRSSTLVKINNENEKSFDISKDNQQPTEKILTKFNEVQSTMDKENNTGIEANCASTRIKINNENEKSSNINKENQEPTEKVQMNLDESRDNIETDKEFKAEEDNVDTLDEGKRCSSLAQLNDEYEQSSDIKMEADQKLNEGNNQSTEKIETNSEQDVDNNKTEEGNRSPTLVKLNDENEKFIDKNENNYHSTEKVEMNLDEDMQVEEERSSYSAQLDNKNEEPNDIEMEADQIINKSNNHDDESNDKTKFQEEEEFEEKGNDTSTPTQFNNENNKSKVVETESETLNNAHQQSQDNQTNNKTNDNSTAEVESNSDEDINNDDEKIHLNMNKTENVDEAAENKTKILDEDKPLSFYEIKEKISTGDGNNELSSNAEINEESLEKNFNESFDDNIDKSEEEKEIEDEFNVEPNDSSANPIQKIDYAAIEDNLSNEAQIEDDIEMDKTMSEINDKLNDNEAMDKNLEIESKEVAFNSTESTAQINSFIDEEKSSDISKIQIVENVIEKHDVQKIVSEDDDKTILEDVKETVTETSRNPKENLTDILNNSINEIKDELDENNASMEDETKSNLGDNEATSSEKDKLHRSFKLTKLLEELDLELDEDDDDEDLQVLQSLIMRDEENEENKKENVEISKIEKDDKENFEQQNLNKQNENVIVEDMPLVYDEAETLNVSKKEISKELNLKTKIQTSNTKILTTPKSTKRKLSLDEQIENHEDEEMKIETKDSITHEILMTPTNKKPKIDEQIENHTDEEIKIETKDLISHEILMTPTNKKPKIDEEILVSKMEPENKKLNLNEMPLTPNTSNQRKRIPSKKYLENNEIESKKSFSTIKKREPLSPIRNARTPNSNFQKSLIKEKLEQTNVQKKLFIVEPPKQIEKIKILNVQKFFPKSIQNTIATKSSSTSTPMTSLNRLNPVVRIKRLKVEKLPLAAASAKPKPSPSVEETKNEKQVSQPSLEGATSSSITSKGTEDLIEDLLAQMDNTNMTTENVAMPLTDEDIKDYEHASKSSIDTNEIFQKIGFPNFNVSPPNEINFQQQPVLIEKFIKTIKKTNLFEKKINVKQTEEIHKILKQLTKEINEFLPKNKNIYVWELKSILNSISNWRLEMFNIQNINISKELQTFWQRFNFLYMQNKYFCEHCKIVTATFLKLQQHIETHQDPRNLLCPICCKGYKRLCALKTHIEKCKQNVEKK